MDYTARSSPEQTGQQNHSVAALMKIRTFSILSIIGYIMELVSITAIFAYLVKYLTLSPTPVNLTSTVAPSPLQAAIFLMAAGVLSIVAAFILLASFIFLRSPGMAFSGHRPIGSIHLILA